MGLQGAFVLPHPPIAVHEIGGGEEKKIRDTLDAFEKVSKEIGQLKPDTIIITSPHSVMYTDYFHISPGTRAVGSFAAFRAPHVRFEENYDNELAADIVKRCEAEGFPAGFEGERDPYLDHGVMVPLYFIRKHYSDFGLIRIGLSGLPLDMHRHFGHIIRDAINASGKNVVFIGSGDLAHCQKEDGPYGFSPEGPEYDDRLMETFKRGKLDELFDYPEKLLDASMECGHRSFCIMTGALDGSSYSAEVLSHEATFGVGYGIVRIMIK